MSSGDGAADGQTGGTEADGGEVKIRPAVFISYRRSDSQHVAGRIAEFLRTRSNLDVLFDVDTIGKGSDYTKEIDRQIAQADAVLVVIGNSWLTTTDSGGQVRIDDPADAVRQEVSAALDQEKVVVPVLVDGANVPSADALPDALAGLAFRNGTSLNHESFRQDLEHLVVDLRGIGARLLSENPAIAAASRYAPVAARNVSEGLVKLTGSLAERYEKRRQAKEAASGSGQSAPVAGEISAPEGKPAAFCSSCGHRLGESDAFCGGCGTKVQ